MKTSSPDKKTFRKTARGAALPAAPLHDQYSHGVGAACRLSRIKILENPWESRHGPCSRILFVMGPLIMPGARISKAKGAGEICAYRVLCTQTPRGTQFLTAAPDDASGMGVGSIQTGGWWGEIMGINGSGVMRSSERREGFGRAPKVRAAYTELYAVAILSLLPL